jgi:hypothetical protein
MHLKTLSKPSVMFKLQVLMCDRHAECWCSADLWQALIAFAIFSVKSLGDYGSCCADFTVGWSCHWTELWCRMLIQQGTAIFLVGTGEGICEHVANATSTLLKSNPCIYCVQSQLNHWLITQLYVYIYSSFHTNPEDGNCNVCRNGTPFNIPYDIFPKSISHIKLWLKTQRQQFTLKSERISQHFIWNCAAHSLEVATQAPQFTTQVQTSLRTSALYLSELDVPHAVHGYWRVDSDGDLNRRVICEEVHVHWNKESLLGNLGCLQHHSWICGIKCAEKTVSVRIHHFLSQNRTHKK